MLRLRALGLAAAAAASLAASIVAVAACITAPPPDLPQGVQHRPTILHDSVVPPPGEILSQLPDQFIVPVELDDPNQTFWWDVFVDFDPLANGGAGTPPVPPYYPQQVTPTPGTVDGGIILVDFNLGSDKGGLDQPTCHRIQFLVAHAFNQSSAHTPDAVGGDVVEWLYNPVSGSAGCPVYDAGALQDGAFPPADAATQDGPLLIPESGVE